MQLTLAQVVEVTGAQLIDARAVDRHAIITGWSIDSRSVKPGDLFFALKGEFHDGHGFVPSVLRAGAVAAVVSEASDSVSGPRLKVPDTLGALQQLAHFARAQWGGQVVAVTGSAGKTSTKDMIATFLGVRLRVGKTIGNLNNHIGLPLSVLRIPDDAEVAVLEMGMNHAEEIRELARIAKPDTGVVTNVGFAHVEAFTSIEGVAAAKRELIEELPERGVAVLNADDERVLQFSRFHRGRTITYGFSHQSQVRAVQLESGSTETAFTVSGVRFRTSLAGRHSISNILAGIAVARVFDIEYEALTSSVEALQPTSMRGEREMRNGIRILNDSYNSNPEAARSMVDVLREEPAKRRIAVLGEMLELGSMSEKLHYELGNYVARAGINVVIGVRGASRVMVEGARQAGLDQQAALFFDDPDSAGDFLRGFARPGDAILFKGSRGTRVEKALARMEQ
jgi:UDP-N-acetylmuramoyl-tripeptide--D-alanyl-D-alanine ligase